MSKRKKKNIIRKNLPILIIIALIATAVYYYISHIEQKELEEGKVYYTHEEFQLLENTDSTKYIAKILITKDMNILALSDEFYKNKMFWPYIFEANDIEDNILNLPIGTILNIPIVETQLLDTNNAEVISKVKLLGDSLLSDINEKRIKDSERNGLGDW